MEIFNNMLFQLFAVIFVFLVLTILGKFIYKKIRNLFGNSLNMNNYLPDDEVHSLTQVFYLILMALCIVNIFYFLTSSGIAVYYFVIFDIVLSLYFAIKMDMNPNKNKIIWLLLIPYESLIFAISGQTLIIDIIPIIIDIIHIIIYVYFAKLNFDKFMEYTNSNGLGITIILLFIVIFGGFFITQYSEGVNALDSLVIVSNQFTGNGYAVFGNTISGKLNSLLLVWGGYVLSGASAATLTAAILIRNFKKEFAELKELIDEGDEE